MFALEKPIRECYISPMKTCRKCGESKPIEAYHARADSVDGFRHDCKACGSRLSSEWARRHPERKRAIQAKWAKMNPGKHRASILRWHKAHPEKVKEMQRRHYANNRTARRAQGKRYAEQNRAKVLARYARRYWNNRERMLAENAAWARVNRDAITVKDAKRVAKKRAAPGRGVTTLQWKEALRDSLGLCAYCNLPRRLTMDHIDPLVRGGAHDPENIAAACKPCNSAKKDKTLIVWLAQRQARAA